MEILLKNVLLPDGNACVLCDCRDCDLRGAPDCQEMADFLREKKRMRDAFGEQEDTEELEGLKRQVGRLEKRVEDLERIHSPPPQPSITQQYPWAPTNPSYPIITCSSEAESDVEMFLSETRVD